jgi:hypothetical protein
MAYLSAKVLGQHIVRAIQERVTRPVLVIGSDTFTRADLSGVTCFNFVAAANLSAGIAPLKVKNTRDLFQHVSPAALALPHVGSVALSVLGAAFEAKGLGGDTPLEAWMLEHAAADAKRPLTTFHAVKAREAKERQQEAKAKKRRKRQRRDEAHQLRVDRFAASQGGDIQ